MGTVKVCIIRLINICFWKSSSTFWQVRCCAHRTQRSCQKYDEDFLKFCCLLRKPKLYDLKSFEFLSRQEKKLEKLLVVGISGFVELAFTFSFNKQRPSYTEKRWIHNSSGKPNYSNFDSTYLVFMIYLTQLSKRSTHLQLHKYLLLHLFNRSRI